MEFSDFVSYVKEYGKRETDLLIVMPAFASYENVQRHLELLEKQTYREFNVLLVLGVPFEDERLQKELEKKKFHFGVIIAKENERRGCSGGFFTGQKYALEKGYGYVIMADDDCMPVDAELVENLYKNREKGYVTSRTKFVADGYRKTAHVSGASQYTLYSVGIFKKYGLYYLPLFHGADDGEYMERIKDASFQIENYSEHPYIAGMRLFSLFDRSWLFMLQSLVIMKSVKTTVYNIVQLGLLLTIALFFLPKYGQRLFFVMNRMLLTYTYGKKAYEGIKSGYAESLADEKNVLEGETRIIDEADPKYVDSGGAQKAGGLFGAAIWAVGKKVFVRNSYSFIKVFFMAITASRLHVKVSEGRCLLVADRKNPLSHAARLVAFPFFLVVYVPLLAVFFIVLKAFKQPKTLGYGLD
ncbi:Uncharacterised protein [Candidatus Anstonella stagnisolia]|nr:Uncharacterised protein [Candidatus Anstonella stagnisolia]